MRPFGFSLAQFGLWAAALAGAALSMRGLSALGVGAGDQFSIGCLGFALYLHFQRRTVILEAEEFLTVSGKDARRAFASGLGSELIGGGVVVAGVLLIANGIGGLAVSTGLLGAFVLGHRLMGPAIARSGTASLRELFALRLGERAARAYSICAVMLSLAFLAASIALACEVFALLFGVPGWLSLCLTGGLLALAVLPGGYGDLFTLQRGCALIALAGLFGAACIFGLVETGVWLPQLAAGPLLHEIAVQELRAGGAQFMQLEPFDGALGALAVALGAGTLPHLLERWTGERRGQASPAQLLAGAVPALLILTSLPLLAVATRLDLLAAPAALPSLPGLSLAAIPLGVLALFIASGAAAVLASVAALGLDHHRETAGSVLHRARVASALIILAALLLAIPVRDVVWSAYPFVLALTAATLLPAALLVLVWPRMTGAGMICGMIAGGVAVSALAWQSEGAYALPLQFGLIAVPFAIGTAIIVSALFDPRSDRRELISSRDP